MYIILIIESIRRGCVYLSIYCLTDTFQGGPVAAAGAADIMEPAALIIILCNYNELKLKCYKLFFVIVQFYS